jgi:WD40 repeat protein
VRALEQAAPRNGDKMQFEIVAALRQLTEQGNVEAQESLCRLVIFHDLSLAREATLAMPCAPREAPQRALFYFLTEQWDKYESLDFDHSLLRAVYEAADEKLRQRIGEGARRAGRVDWVEVAAGGRRGRRLGEMTDREWEVTLEVLSGSGRWAEMWRLAQEAPARWSARLLQRVSSAKWVPEGDGEQAGYEELTLLAGRWTDVWLGPLVRCSAVLEGHTRSIKCLAISSDGRTLASGSGDHTVRLWNLPDGAHLKTLEGHTMSIRCLVISPNGRTLANGSKLDTMLLWNLPDGAHLKTLSKQTLWVNCFAIGPDGRTLASGGAGGLVQLWSLPGGRHLKTLNLHRYEVYCLAISPDGRTLASGGQDNLVQLWSLPDGRHLKMLKGHTSSIGCLAINPNGRMLASGSDDHTVRLWSLPDGAHLKTLEGHAGDVDCLAISPDGRVLASSSMDHTARLWNLPDGVHLKTLEGHTKGVGYLAISPDGRTLASGSDDHTVRLWSLPDGAHLKTLGGHRDEIFCLAISPDGQVLVSGSRDRTVRLWTNPSSHLPISQMSLEDLAWVQKALRDGNLPAEERNCLEFIAALMRWRRRFDIEVGEATQRIEVGEFDIEIEG